MNIAVHVARRLLSTPITVFMGPGFRRDDYPNVIDAA